MLYKIWKNNPDDKDSYKLYIEYNKMLNKLLKITKNNYEKNRLKNLNSNKQFWRYINSKIKLIKMKNLLFINTK